MQHSLYSHYLNSLQTHEQSAQALWNGCGFLDKFQIGSCKYAVKLSKVPDDLKHVNIRQTPFSLQRKVRSYVKEQYFYTHYVESLPMTCHTPKVIELHEFDGTFVTLLEDFEQRGFHNKADANSGDIERTLKWLAGFHANWLRVGGGESSFGLLGYGNYWHLKTRPDEFEKMPASSLKSAAHAINEKLDAVTFKTLIHGDAKLANFAFNDTSVIGYDFQHTGIGLGLSDVMLLFTTVLDSEQLSSCASNLLDIYFTELREQIKNQNVTIEVDLLENEWRESWCFIWADFHRFLAGWKPEHPKINQYMKTQTQLALSKL
ncbi:phosphotransferase [Pseudoalteromonas luteoviolacea]|uniref:phosphotransferase n=1 Tax=Pseudoalteromonas luteoviolacea TaxID=43657 RepID=UPI001B383BB3|nr:phosphotransferase [Pseudoalteromonas luteoviolacea]MBQ4835052.1 phosphotransferase [Pseudoalteromonas luteoviolacea]